MHRDLGAACGLQGDDPAAAAHLQQAMDLYRQLGDQPGQAHTYLYLCMNAGRQGQLRDALEHARQAQRLFRAAGHLAGQANALTNAAYCPQRTGRARAGAGLLPGGAAAARAAAATSTARATPGPASAPPATTWAAASEALDCDRRAVTVFRGLGDQHLLAEALTQLGDHLHDGGRGGEARAAWQEAFTILDDLRHPSARQVQARLDPAPPAGRGLTRPRGLPAVR